MAMTLSSLCSSNPSLKPPQISLKLPLQTRHSSRNHCGIIPFLSNRVKSQPLKTHFAHNSLPFSGTKLGFSFGRNLGFRVNASNGEGENQTIVDKAEEEARGQSTMPERFRYLTKEAPDPPVRWPWLIALVFLTYAWRTVLWELGNWRKVLITGVHFVGYLLKFVLALIFHFIGNPITASIKGIETTLYGIRAFYSGLVAYTPVRELTVIIMLSSAMLAIAEASVPDSVNSQPYLLTLAGLIGYVAVRNSISEIFFWTLLFGMFGYSRLIKKRDYVSSALPVAAVLAAIGEPWVRIVVIASYLGLAITHHARNPPRSEVEGEVIATERKLPLPLLCAAMAIGIRAAAKWAGYRHLTWMVA